MLPKRDTEKSLARLILAAVLLANVVGLWPELSISSIDLNDNALHYPLIQGVVQAIEHGKNPVDWWAPDWSLGYPVLSTYQPLGHLLVAIAYFALGKSVSLMTVFVWVRYLSVVLFPLTVFVAARWLGLRPLTAAAAALLSPLISTSALYGLEYGSYLWAGSGLFTQAIASHFLVLAIGLGYRAIKFGRALAITGIVVGLAFLAHFIYGYMAGLTLLLLVCLPDSATRITTRLLRLTYVGAAALVLASFELVPLLTAGDTINRSRWEYTWKWDSFGAPQVLRWLFTGELLDHGRLPVFTILAFLGLACVLWPLVSKKRGERVLERNLEFLAAGAAVWILIFFGRPFWGPLLSILLAKDALQLHRVIGGVQVFLIFLAAVGLSGLWFALARRRHQWILAVAITAVLLYPMVAERTRYLAMNRRLGYANLAVFEKNQPFIDTALNDARGRGGRAYAGLAASWGRTFRIGEPQFYCFLSTARVPTLGFLFHSMALTSDIMVRFNEQNPYHYQLFNVRTVIAPPQVAPTLPLFLTPLEQAGDLSIFKAPGSGYFDVVDAPYSVRVSRDSLYDSADRWLQSDWPSHKQHVILDLNGTMPSASGRLSPDDPLPSAPVMQPPGVVKAEQQNGDRYEADVQALRPGYVMFKMTWHPAWAAYVNGVRRPTLMLTPGFVGVPVEPGTYHIALAYEPAGWKMALMFIGPLLAGLLLFGERRGWASAFEQRVEHWVDATSGRPSFTLSPVISRRILTAAGLVGISLPVCVELVTPRVPGGHDALEYLPRLVEFHENIIHGILLPKWAPDLSNGFGQPLFLFNPPLIYYFSEAWHLAGADFVRSINLACVTIVLGSAIAMFLLGRLYGGAPGGWMAAVAFLYAPYFSVDLYVRSALAEFAAFPFFAITLFGFGSYARRRSRWYLALGAAAYACVLLSHNPAALLFTPLVLAFLVFTAWEQKSWRILAAQVGGLSLGLALAAWVWLPAIAERSNVQLDLLRQGYLRYSNHFVFPTQLVSWFWGYGLSVPGADDGMSFSIGWTHVLLAVVAIFAALRWKKMRRARPAIFFFGLAAIALCFLSLRQASWIWDRLTLLQFVEFPWRLLGTVAVCVAVLLAPLGSRLWKLPNKVWFAAVMALLVVPNLAHLKLPFYRDVDLAFWSPEQIARRGIGVDTADEYRPRWMTAATLNSGLRALPRSRPDRWLGSTDFVADTWMQIPIAYYPGWKAQVDGTSVPVEPDPASGLLRCRVPAGKHQVSAVLTDTAPVLGGNVISLLALALFAWLIRPKSWTLLIPARARRVGRGLPAAHVHLAAAKAKSTGIV